MGGHASYRGAKVCLIEEPPQHEPLAHARRAAHRPHPWHCHPWIGGVWPRRERPGEREHRGWPMPVSRRKTCLPPHPAHAPHPPRVREAATRQGQHQSRQKGERHAAVHHSFASRANASNWRPRLVHERGAHGLRRRIDQLPRLPNPPCPCPYAHSLMHSVSGAGEWAASFRRPTPRACLNTTR